MSKDEKNEPDDVLFAPDTRGDPLVWQFGGNDARRVPAYHRYGNGRAMLGSQSRFTFDNVGGKNVFYTDPAYNARGSVFREKNNLILLRAMRGASKAASSRPGARNRPKSGGRTSAAKIAESDGSDAADFVALRASKKRKRGSDAGSGNESESTDHNDDHTSKNGSETSGEASGDDSDDNDIDNIFVVGDGARETLKGKLAELSRRVKDEPQDVDAWLQLVDLQDQQTLLLANDDVVWDSVSGGPTRQQARSRDEAAGISNMKLSILESALPKVHLPAARERLQLAIMRESAKVWTSKQLAQRWADLARGSNAQGGSGLSFALWKARLDFEMTSLTTLTLDGIKAFLVERLRALEQDAAGCTSDTDKRLELYSEMVYVFLRTTRFLSDAGFQDLAAAAWQAMLEATFARPGTAAAGIGLGAFWDSEVPRIGEDGAQGWASYADAVRLGHDAEALVLERDAQTQVLPIPDLVDVARRAVQNEVYDVDEYKPLYEAWVIVERQRAALARLPARVVDDMDDSSYEDVFRVVVFSDIESLLFTIPQDVLVALQPLVVDAFLLFCQMPPAFATSAWMEVARNDPFLAIVVLAGHNGGEKTAETGPEAEDALLPPGGRSLPELFYDGSRMAASLDLLFSTAGWFRYFPSWLNTPAAAQPASTSDAETPPVPPQWVANTLRQLTRTFGYRPLAVFSLAVDAALNPSGAKKAARTLLKKYTSETALYEAYALAEASQGNDDAARAALSASAASMNKDTDAVLALLQTWAWLDLERGRGREEALRHLLTDLSPGEEKAEAPITPAQLLRARQAFRTGMDYALSRGLLQSAALFAQSFVLLEYLSAPTDGPDRLTQPRSRQDGHLDAALLAATAFSREMEARGHLKSVFYERFLQSTVARIVYFHARHGPYRPAELQAPLHRLVTLFPQNGLFLRLFAWVDPAAATGLTRIRPDNPLRQVLDTIVLTPAHDCPSSRAFAIRQALQQGQGQGHAARAEFERALGGSGSVPDANPACLGNARLWQAYVHLTAMEAVAMKAATSKAVTGSGKEQRRSRARRSAVDKRMVALAKDVYYRSVRACPGSKAVLLEAFGPHTGLVAASDDAGMTPSDLRTVFQTVVGKGLRVHVDLTDVRERARTALAEARPAGRGR